MHIGLVGDVVLARALGPSGVRKLRSVIVGAGQCDVVVANLESVFHDYEFPPAAESGGSWLRCPPAAASDLAAAGVDVVSRANNHAGDWGLGGMVRTGEVLDHARITHAGVGVDADDAFSPRCVTTGSGKLCVVSFTTTTPRWAAAGRGGGGVMGRPGVAFVRVYEDYVVPDNAFTKLCDVWDGLLAGSGGDQLEVAGLRFVRGSEFERRATCDRRALESATAAVRQARECSNVVVASVHSHQEGNRVEDPSEALVEIVQSLIGAGADIVACHGPHMVGGVARHGNGVGLYGLGNFIFQPAAIERTPPDAFGDRRRPGRPAWESEADAWRSVVAVCTVGSGGVAVRLVPVVIDGGPETADYGLPRLAEARVGSEILQVVANASARFGTVVRKNGEVA